MFNKIAAALVAAVVPAIIAAVKPELEKLAADAREHLTAQARLVLNDARSQLEVAARDAVVVAFKALDRNGDGKIDIRDIVG